MNGGWVVTVQRVIDCSSVDVVSLAHWDTEADCEAGLCDRARIGHLVKCYITGLTTTTNLFPVDKYNQ